MAYPAGGWHRWVYHLPILMWRLGLSRFTPPNFLLLTTTGRKSGKPRQTMLEYTWLDGHIYLASGWGERSQWYQNLCANPMVTVQTARHGTWIGKVVRVTEDTELGRFYVAARGNSPIWKKYLASWGVDDDRQDFLEKKERLIILRVDPLDSAPSFTRS